MVTEDAYSKTLGYIKKHDHINTFRLARELGIDRNKILNIIKKLEEKQAVEVKSGTVKFLKFVAKEKTIKAKAISRPKKIEKLEDTIKTLRQKAKTPKIVRRTKIKEIIKRVPVKSRKLAEQAERIEELEETIKELQKKLSAKPKIVTRTIKVPEIITRTKVKTIIKKVPVRAKEKKKIEAKPMKFKLPKINFPDIKNIQQLERPDFLEQKIRAGKFNFSGLNKNIQQLNVPEVLRNN
ncbi:MAG: hypothetical protein AABX74_00865 [Nanoarchaeota archaeon]